MIQEMKFVEAQTTTEQEQKNTTPLEHGHTSVLEKANNVDYGMIEGNRILDTQKIDNTPFHIISMKDDNGDIKCFTAIGNQRVSKLNHGTVDLLEKIYDKDWELIVSLITIITERVYEQLKREDIARNTNT